MAYLQINEVPLRFLPILQAIASFSATLTLEIKRPPTFFYSLSLQMYRLDDSLELVEVPEKVHGAFFGEDCYVIQYQYEKNGQDQFIIYFWQGLNANNDQRAASAGHVVRMDDALGGQAVQVMFCKWLYLKHKLQTF